METSTVSPKPHPPLEREQSRSWFQKYSTMRAYVPMAERAEAAVVEDPNAPIADYQGSPRNSLPASPPPFGPVPPPRPAYIDRVWAPVLRHHRMNLPTINFAESYKPELMYIVKEIIETEADYLDDIGMSLPRGVCVCVCVSVRVWKALRSRSS